MLDLLSQSPVLFLAVGLALILAVTVHEFAHAWTATKLGDPTPRLQGRLTLNPLAHLDLLGTFLLVLVGFGWGKPVQFDPYNLENPRRDAAIISLAGPVSNLIFASAISLIFRAQLAGFISLIIPLEFFYLLIRLNVILAVFNLIPVHPLDGGKILVGLLPPRDAALVDIFMQKYGIFILFILIFPLFGTSPVFTVMSPVINALLNIYLPGASV